MEKKDNDDLLVQDLENGPNKDPLPLELNPDANQESSNLLDIHTDGNSSRINTGVPDSDQVIVNVLTTPSDSSLDSINDDQELKESSNSHILGDTSSAAKSQEPENQSDNSPPRPPESSGSETDTDDHLYLRSPYGRKEKSDYLDKGRPLYEAAKNGKWDEAEGIFNEDGDAVGAYITEGRETALHIAALENQVEFVRRLVARLQGPDERLRVLEIKNDKGNTAFCLAAVCGNVEIARQLKQAHPRLLLIRNAGGYLPVMMAASLGHEAMVETLLDESNTIFWSNVGDADLLILLKKCIMSDLFVTARRLTEEKPELAFYDAEVVQILATKPMAEECKKGIWQNFFGSGMKEADSREIEALKLFKFILDFASNRDSNINLNIENIVKTSTWLLFEAAERGNFHCFKWVIYYYPELVWKTNIEGVSMFHVAVKHHHEPILALLHDMESVRKLVTTYVDNEDNNMLHLAATLAPRDKLNTVNGAAFQMQQAICWYKAVEKIVPPAYVNMKNKQESTPADIFDEKHKGLLEMGEKWMKATAKSCMFVAALNATVIFASAFTVPGGIDNKGHPYSLNKLVCFQLCSISQVIGMLSSSISIIMFLSILTYRVNKYSFQSSLPWKLIIGVAALFVSVAFMAIAFYTALYLSYGHLWLPGLLLLSACVPILLIYLNIPLLVDIIHSPTFVSCFRCQSSCNTSPTTKPAARTLNVRHLSENLDEFSQ